MIGGSVTVAEDCIIKEPQVLAVTIGPRRLKISSAVAVKPMLGTVNLRELSFIMFILR